MLHVHRSERADRLADGLATALITPLADPFMADVVAVPTRGIERWLAQRLSTRLGVTDGREDGICANVDFPFPGRLIVGALAEATNIEPDNDPWLAERSVWPLLELVDECIDEPWLETLKAHLDGARPEPDDPVRRFGVVRHIADLFDHYGVHRPEMIRGWAAGADTGATEAPWQPELWRRLRKRINEPSPAERLNTACSEIRAHPDLLDLPPRLSLFGLTRIPRSYLEVLAAIAYERDVHLFVLHPSPALWQKVAETIDPEAPIAKRAKDPTADIPSNRLLASWGRDARELQLVLASTGGATDDHHSTAHTTGTLLRVIQEGIRADRPPPEEPLPQQPDDDSLQIHSCHGRARQVEVLRDAVLHLLEDDPTLEPRDIIVMCPDIETFAPLTEATFGTGRTGDPAEDDEPESDNKRPPDLRVRLADRSLRQTNPLLSVVAQLLTLADQRVTASQLLDLADREPVRRRFRFDDDDIAQLRDWVVASGIRWGFDAPHREPFKLGSLEANTWRSGLDRILLGVTMTEDDLRLLAKVLPLDDVDSGVIDLAGRFAEFVDRVRTAVDGLQQGKAIPDWADTLADAADSLAATSERDSWQRTELQRLLDDMVDQASGEIGGSSPAVLELADLQGLLADRLRGRPTRANFRTGHLTICTLVPMRSVPHRVVCILGLDDGAFPRKAPRDGDDLILRDPHVGDRDPRTEDRQMLLDALMAATERVIITYTGNDERTNLPRPPAVPVGELLDVVDRSVSSPDGPARDRVVIRHPLQPFDPRNFSEGALVPERLWSFDQVSLAGARALTGERAEPPPFLESPLPADDGEVIELRRLVRFVEHPAKAFLRDRLEISVTDFSDEVDDALPVELDGLEQWQVGQRVLDGVLAGQDINSCVKAEVARGSLPPGKLGLPVMQTIANRADLIARAAQKVGHCSPSSLDVNLELPDGRRLTGTVPGVCNDTVRIVSYSRVKPKDRLRAWVWLLALTATRPERPFESMVIGRARSAARNRAEVTIARIQPLGDDPGTRREAALSSLALLIDLYGRGMREPLPLISEASAAYAEAALNAKDAEAAGREAWESRFRIPKEDQQPEHVVVFGDVLAFEGLLEERPRKDEQGDGWDEAEPTRLGRYARRLWTPLLAREVVKDQ